MYDYNDPRFTEILRKAAEEDKLVLFIGNGVSRLIGLPSWDKFALEHLKHLYKDKKSKDEKIITFYVYDKAKHLPPIKLISICLQICEEEKIKMPIYESWFISQDSDKQKKYGDIFMKLTKTQSMIITTNYDLYLDLAKAGLELDQVRSPSIDIERELSFSALKKKKILHLHGSVKDQINMIKSLREYVNKYRREETISKFFQEIPIDCTFLFIGYGLEDYELLEHLFPWPGDEGFRIYTLQPFFRSEDQLAKTYQYYYKSLGIELVKYPLDEGYEYLYEVVSELADIITPKPRTQKFIDKIRMIDEVLDES